jgi:hypothetical protein
MTLINTRFDPEFLVRFTPEEVEMLRLAATRHYDSTCRSLATPGGRVWVLMNAVKMELPIETILRNYDIQILCKVLENAPRETTLLYCELRSLLDVVAPLSAGG